MKLDLRGLTDVTDETAVDCGNIVSEMLLNSLRAPQVTFSARGAGLSTKYLKAKIYINLAQEFRCLDCHPTPASEFRYLLNWLKTYATEDGVEILTGD